MVKANKPIIIVVKVIMPAISLIDRMSQTNLEHIQAYSNILEHI